MPVEKDIVMVAVIDGTTVHSVQTNSQAVQYAPYDNLVTGAVPGWLSLTPSGNTLTVSLNGLGAPHADWQSGHTETIQVSGELFGGAQPFQDLRIHLRAIPLHMLLLEGHTTTLAMPAITGHTLSMTAGAGELAFAPGATSFGVTKNGDPWTTADAEFDLTVTLNDGSSDVSTALLTGGGARPIRSLRTRTPFTGYTFMEHQSAGAPGINATLPPDTSVQESPPGIVTLDDDLALTGVDGTLAYPSDSIFTLDFSFAGILTLSPTGNIDLALRTLSGASGVNEFDVSHTGGFVSVSIADATYAWTGLSGGAGLPTPVDTMTMEVLDLDYTGSLPLDPLASATYTATVQLGGGGHPSSTIPLTINAMEVLLALGVEVNGSGGTVLPVATADGAYPGADILATGTTGLGTTFTWTLPSGNPEALTLFDITATTNPAALVAGGTVPTGWGGTDRTFTIRVQELSGTILVAEGEAVFSLHTDAAALAAQVDVALLLDRSGSMANFGRWGSAISSAHAFADLVMTENDSDSNLDHQVTVLWFGGWGFGSDLNYDTAATPPENTGLPGNPHGPANAGTLFGDPASSSTELGFEKPSPTYLTNIDAAETNNDTPYWTALGTGLLYARDRLMTRPTDRARLLLALSDGIENRDPRVGSGSTSDVATQWGTPDVSVYGVVFNPTAASYANMVAAAGLSGGGASAVKQVTTLDLMELQTWYDDRFQALFGWTSVIAPTDPPIAQGETIPHEVEITLADGVFVFTAYFAGRPSAQGVDGEPAWELAIQPPGPNALLITESGGGVTFKEGPMYRRVVVRLPLGVEGHEHRWPGTWTVHVTCNERGGSEYTPTAIKRAFDPNSAADRPQLATAVIPDGSPRVGHGARVIAWVSQEGEALDDAHVTGHVIEAGDWPGELLADVIAEMRHDGTLQDEDAVHGSPVEQAMEMLLQSGYLPDGPQRMLHFSYDDEAGHYAAALELPDPGRYRVHVAARGKVRDPSFEPEAFGQAVADLARHYRGQALRAEMDALEDNRGPNQRYRLEKHTGLTVPFLPDAAESSPAGRMLGNGKIRLQVKPRSADGALLGPGWAHAISFHGPSGAAPKWEAVDGDSGLYYADIELSSSDTPALVSEHALWAKKLRLKHRGRWLKPGGSRLALDGFYAEALGVRIPITVRPKMKYLVPRFYQRYIFLDFYAEARRYVQALEQQPAQLSASKYEAFRGATGRVQSLLRAELSPTARHGALSKIGAGLAERELRGVADALAGTPVEPAIDALTDVVADLAGRLADTAQAPETVSRYLQELGSVRTIVQDLERSVRDGGDDDCDDDRGPRKAPGKQSPSAKGAKGKKKA